MVIKTLERVSKNYYYIIRGEIKNESWERERNCIFQRSKTDELAAGGFPIRRGEMPAVVFG